MKSRHKIFYVSGMISLIFIPLLFWYFATPTLKRMELTVIDVYLPFKAKPGQKMPENSQIPMEGWNYKPVTIKPNFGEKDEFYFKSLIERMTTEGISKSGIKFQFGNENSYGDFVKILNLMEKTNQEMYGFDMDKTTSLYVLYNKPNSKNDYPLYNDDVGENYTDQTDYDYKHSSFWQKLIKFSPKETFYLIFGYLILMYFSILKPKITFNL